MSSTKGQMIKLATLFYIGMYLEFGFLVLAAWNHQILPAVMDAIIGAYFTTKWQSYKEQGV